MTTVICAGVAVLDMIMFVAQMPQHAEKYRATDAMVVGGGNAATAAAAIARLGGRACLAARLGDDQIADMIVAGLENDGVDCTLVRRFHGRKSSFSSIFIDAAGERQIVNFRDTDLDTDGAWLGESVLPVFDAVLADTRWPQGAAALMRLARAQGKPAILDAESPFEHAGDALAAATHIAFSSQGLRDYAGRDDIAAGLRKAAAETSAWVCVTQGADGVSWLDGNALRHMPAFTIKTVDTLGAGDIWHGAFALALGQGHDEPAAMRLANAAAAIKCSRHGGRAGAPTGDELAAFLAR